MNCETARIQIVAYLKGELTEAQRRRLEEHLARCADCRLELEKARNVLNWVDAASDDAVVALVEGLIEGALAEPASDIHLEPQEDGGLRVRVRIDGVLHDRERIAPVQRPGVVARLKMLSGMNVGQSQVPQEGRYDWESGGRGFNLRLRCLPFVGGEGIVVRILDKARVSPGLENIGFSAERLQDVRDAIRQPTGLLIVCGPIGSGKTTTCYSILQELQSDEIKTVSIEHPVDYILPGVCQIQIDPSAGLTYGAAMRAVLSSDPDVIFIAALDDAETVKAACEAALTGHLVLAQVHAESVTEACERLVHVGVDPYYLSCTLLGVVSQRLVRKVCVDCRERLTDVSAAPPLFRFLSISQEDLDAGTAYSGRGCDHCRRTGHRGRSTIHEVLICNAASAKAMADGDFTPKAGWNYTSMLDDARAKVLAGVTSPDEARRVMF
jgi:type II secretory ATPase GspE/PulE/Tfp pilus assembly ATPase PilB-like protein